MSNSQHPVALRVERAAGDGTRLLATVMCLPLVDGIFPALVLAGALSGPLGVLEVGLLVFGGSATVAVILAELEGTPRENVRSVLGIGLVLVPLAAIEAALAPTIAGLVDLAIFERFAALVILAVAAKTASARVGELLPRPGAIIGLGLLASVDPAGARLVMTLDGALVARATAAAGAGIAFALAVAWFGPRLREFVVLDRFRFGSAVALGVFALSLLGLVPSEAPIALAVLAITGLFALDPGEDSEIGIGVDGASRSGATEPSGGATGYDGNSANNGVDVAVDESDGNERNESDDPGRFEDRAPWL
jgi:hypothetical protein